MYGYICYADLSGALFEDIYIHFCRLWLKWDFTKSVNLKTEFFIFQHQILQFLKACFSSEKLTILQGEGELSQKLWHIKEQAAFEFGISKIFNLPGFFPSLVWNIHPVLLIFFMEMVLNPIKLLEKMHYSYEK